MAREKKHASFSKLDTEQNVKRWLHFDLYVTDVQINIPTVGAIPETQLCGAKLTSQYLKTVIFFNLKKLQESESYAFFCLQFSININGLERGSKHMLEF